MGLAAYGGPNPVVSERLEQLIQIEAERYDVSPKFTIGGNHTHGVSFSDAFVELFGPPRRRGGELTDWYRDIAYAAQECLERGIEAIRPGSRISVIGTAVEQHARANGFSVAVPGSDAYYGVSTGIVGERTFFGA